MRDADRVEYEWVFRSCYASVLRTAFLVLHDRGAPRRSPRTRS